MTTPPLDLPAERLAALRELANAATPGPWWHSEIDLETKVFAGEGSGDDVEVATSYGAEEGRYIAAFDPPTVLALLDRVEELEAEVGRLGELIGDYSRDNKNLANAANSSTARAEAAEKAVAAVRELHALDTHVCECGDTHGPYCKTCQYDYPCPTITALDGTP